jgi:hypothetical protein
MEESNQEIFVAAGLTKAETALMPAYIAEEVDFYGSSAYEKLYGYFLDGGEMPYLVAKARTGDPDFWIIDYLETNESR